METGVALDIGSACGVWRERTLHRDTQVRRCVCVFALNTGPKSGPGSRRPPDAGCPRARGLWLISLSEQKDPYCRRFSNDLSPLKKGLTSEP